ncbi:MAG: outer membrane beta-barrel protein [Bacteroidetes bacterium]|nr:outer membrane beta-barrel protein [Bacteroidota bacterium]
MKSLKFSLIPMMVLALVMMSNTSLFAKTNYFGLTPYASFGYFASSYTCDVNLLILSTKLDAEATGTAFKVGAQLEIPVTNTVTFTPAVEFQQAKVDSYSYKDNKISASDLPFSSDDGTTSQFINIPLMFNLYFSSDNSGLFVGVGPKLNLNLSKEEDQVFSTNSLVVAGSATVGYQMKNGLRLAAVADRTLTSIFNDEDSINNNKITSISGNNLYIGAVIGYRF